MRHLFRTVTMALLASSAVAEDTYFPMHVGDEWISATTSSIAGITNPDVHTKIDGVAEVNGKTYFRERIWTDALSPGEPRTGLKRIDEKAVYTIDEKEKDSGEQILIVLPLTVGATWRRNIGKFEATYTVVGLESVKIADKIYENCYHLRQSIPEHFVMDYWLAPNVGQVKSETVFPTGLKLGSMLREFKPGR